MIRPLMLLVGVAVLGGCSYDEGYFQRRIKALDELAAKATDTTRKRIEEKKAELLKDFKALPKEDGRQKALDNLCRRARMVVEEAEKIVAGQVVEGKPEDKKKLAEYQKKFVGHWQGENMTLNIAENGKVDYERKKPGGMSSKINAFILEFHLDRFKVGFMGMGTNFRIDKAPYEEGGKWKMKIDGVELTRLGGGTTPQYGTFVCTRYEEERCVDPATELEGDKLEKIHALHVTRTVPEKGQKFLVTWIAEQVGEAAPPNTTIATTPLTYDGANQDKADHFTIHGNLSRPTKGWPPGAYRVEVSTKDAVIGAVKFQITGKKPAIKAVR